MPHKVQNKNDFSLFTPAEKLFVCNLNVAKGNYPMNSKVFMKSLSSSSHLPKFINSVLGLELGHHLANPTHSLCPMANQTPQ